MARLSVICAFLFLALCCNNSSTESANVRRPAVAGAFYSSDSSRLAKSIDMFTSQAEVDVKKRPVALISPVVIVTAPVMSCDVRIWPLSVPSSVTLPISLFVL